MSSIRDLVRRLAGVEQAVAALSSPQLGHSSIESDESLEVRDGDGNTTVHIGHQPSGGAGVALVGGGTVEAYDPEEKVAATFGRQWDGSYGAVPVVGPKPPTPSAPIVTPFMAGLKVRWDGTFEGGEVAPMDFSRVEVHVHEDPNFDPQAAASLRQTIESPRGSEVTIPLSVREPHTVRLVARSVPGKSSDPSVPTVATPGQISTDDIPEGGINPYHIAKGSLTPDKLNVGQHFIH